MWIDSEKAQNVLRQLSRKKDIVTSWREIEKKAGEMMELIELAISENDSSLEQEITSELDKVQQKLEAMETKLLFQGDYDSRSAILAIHAGAGGTEAQDWAQMLLRMYLRWAEQQRFKAEVLEVMPGDEAGIKSALVEVRGEDSYGLLKSEHGVHRLVRLSPFDADHARHTSFALIEVLPEAEGESEVKINPEDLKLDFFRASGPGGQHMQKTSTAVRITHMPTGTVVTYQSERSQHQNKEVALKILSTRLLEKEIQKKVEERAKLKGVFRSAEWGSQIRSYVLHPYKMVKDHRTGVETGDATGVLDGKLDAFIKAYLSSLIGKEE